MTASAALRERRSKVNPQAEGEFLSNFHGRRGLNWRCLPALLNLQGVNQRPHAAIVLGLCGALLSGGAIANYTKCLPADDCQAAALSFAISGELTSHAAHL